MTQPDSYSQSTIASAKPGWLVWREEKIALQSEIARLETLLGFAQREAARLELAHGAAMHETRELRAHVALFTQSKESTK